MTEDLGRKPARRPRTAVAKVEGQTKWRRDRKN
jgi:hypothetical protein